MGREQSASEDKLESGAGLRNTTDLAAGSRRNPPAGSRRYAALPSRLVFPICGLTRLRIVSRFTREIASCNYLVHSLAGLT